MAIAELKMVSQCEVESMMNRHLLGEFGNVANNGDGQFIVKSEVDGDEFVGQTVRKLNEFQGGMVSHGECHLDGSKMFSFTGFRDSIPVWTVLVIFQ